MVVKLHTDIRLSPLASMKLIKVLVHGASSMCRSVILDRWPPSLGTTVLNIKRRIAIMYRSVNQ